MASMGALRAVESAMAQKKKQPVSAFGALREVEAKMPTVPGVSAAPKVPQVPTVASVRSELERLAAEREAQRRQEYLAQKARERAERIATMKEAQAAKAEPKPPSPNVWEARTEISRLGWAGPVRIPEEAPVARTAQAAPATTGMGALREAEAAQARTPAAMGALREAEARAAQAAPASVPTVPGLPTTPLVPGTPRVPGVPAGQVMTVSEPERKALAQEGGPPPGYSEVERQAYLQAGGIQGALERLEGVPGGGAVNIQETIRRTVDEIMRGYDQAAPNVQLMYGQLLDQLTASLEATEASIRRMFEQQMGGIDPATQAALSQLREAMREKREQLLADLNRRGLLQSGIALEMQARLHRNELTAEEQLIAGRFQQLQDQLNNALMQFAQQRLNLATQLGVAGIQSAERQALQRQQALMGALQTGISLAGLEAQERARQEQAALAERQFASQEAARLAGLTGYLPTGQPTLERQQFEWQQRIWPQQFALQAARAAPQPPTIQESLRDAAYAKLAQGYTVDQLTEGERVAIGIRPATERTFSPAEVRAKALQLAQTDPRWTAVSDVDEKGRSRGFRLPTAEERLALVQEYESWLAPQSSVALQPIAPAQLVPPTPPTAASMGALRAVESIAGTVDALRRQGYSEDEIAALIRPLGYNPATFGVAAR